MVTNPSCGSQLGMTPGAAADHRRAPLRASVEDQSGTTLRGFQPEIRAGSILVTTSLPFDEWTEMFGSERLTGALLDRLTHHVHIIEMNGESYRLRQSSRTAATSS